MPEDFQTISGLCLIKGVNSSLVLYERGPGFILRKVSDGFTRSYAFPNSSTNGTLPPHHLTPQLSSSACRCYVCTPPYLLKEKKRKKSKARILVDRKPNSSGEPWMGSWNWRSRQICQKRHSCRCPPRDIEGSAQLLGQVLG